MMKYTNTSDAQPATVSLRSSFFSWYYLEKPGRMVRSYRLYAHTVAEVFSIIFLLKTLLSPWKNIKENYPTKGFNLARISEALTLNLITRLIGAVIRLGAIIVGLLAQIALCAGFIAYLLVWLTFPLLIILSIPTVFFFLFA